MHSSVLLFLNIGSSEMILIVFAALLLFGGEKLPEIARGLGKGIRDFKDASDGVKREINNQINSYEEKKTEEKMLAERTEEINNPTVTPDHQLVEHTMPVSDSHIVANDQEDVEHHTDTHTTPVVDEHHTEVHAEPVAEHHAETTTGAETTKNI